jgi:pyridoxal phosphate enzyme (YggS family)
LSSPPDPIDNSADPLRRIRARIDAAASAAGRDPAEVTLTAVSKQQPWPAVEPLLRAGQTVFGENRVQEAASRWAAQLEHVELRLIGPLQTNKVRDAVELFDVIETVDRDRLAERLAGEAQRRGCSPRLYVQVNTGEEPQKAGVSPSDVDAFVALCRGRYDLPIEGLMCIPPEAQPPAPHFALLAKIAARNGLPRLSMGMSADFEIAVRHGATSVRVGSALFGPRSPSPAAGRPN